MLEQYFEDNFKGFRDEIRQELNSRIYGAIQDIRGDVAESFFMEAKQKVKPLSAKKEVELDPESEEGRRIAAADFAMKQDVFGEERLEETNFRNLYNKQKSTVSMEGWPFSNKRNREDNTNNNKKTHEARGKFKANTRGHELWKSILGSDKKASNRYWGIKESSLKEDTAEFIIDLHFPDGQVQKDFRVMGANEDDLKTRLTSIFGSNNGYKFENIRKNEG